jgi:predicted O-linked N-acetylglucosamine transferase (SPINDLY family)
VDIIDYRLTDAHIDPPGGEHPATAEKAERLPDCWCCYEPVEEFPLVGPLPAAHNGYVTFGSLNQFRKIHEGLLRCWASLLKMRPQSRLLMICPSGQTQEQTRAFFAAHGIAGERLDLVAPCRWREYSQLFAKIDLALDSSPGNGMTTTCHALWMGVPMVTLAGASAISRAGSSLLQAAGLPEWIAHDEDEYLSLAAQWATDLPRLAALRATLRSRMKASPLMDVPRFARNIEAAYRTMWQRWCAKNPSPAQ